MAPAQGFDAFLDVIIEDLLRQEIIPNALEHIIHMDLRFLVLSPQA